MQRPAIVVYPSERRAHDGKVISSGSRLITKRAFDVFEDMPQWLQERVAMINLLDEDTDSDVGAWEKKGTLAPSPLGFNVTNYFVVIRPGEEDLWSDWKD